MTLDRLFAVLALACFTVFLGIIAFKVMRVDLFTACGIGLALACYDLWRTLYRDRA